MVLSCIQHLQRKSKYKFTYPVSNASYIRTILSHVFCCKRQHIHNPLCSRVSQVFLLPIGYLCRVVSSFHGELKAVLLPARQDGTLCGYDCIFSPQVAVVEQPLCLSSVNKGQVSEQCTQKSQWRHLFEDAYSSCICLNPPAPAKADLWLVSWERGRTEPIASLGCGSFAVWRAYRYTSRMQVVILSQPPSVPYLAPGRFYPTKYYRHNESIGFLRVLSHQEFIQILRYLIWKSGEPRLC